MEIIFYAVLIIAFGSVIFSRIKKAHSRKDDPAISIFNKLYLTNSIHAPKLNYQLVYSFPYYTITFIKKSDYEYCESKGINQLFKEEIQQLHMDHYKFDVHKAVYFNVIEA
ncbi:hypothetical protein [Aureibacter tunicatorum]|uniref:Uncharacterized protein n=1 Tax=Aureibacter tunicatorum TaxID=866807 RepID=A0AAE4BVK7_9BACT|nr:hypothetical protein [Aureibacter tunicatorum]MDR6241813.1 hypothetical protein [Aureibacter tunicatorum]BDD07060.1 hypothetical protein AUTU_45430 [Aureibacter tunicatorum]